jgi:transcriptional regulator with XRE-family HTH domain
MNIGEIARRSGVSRSTVSYALSGKRTVAEATKRRIQEVIDELDYRPNAAARALKEGRTRTPDADERHSRALQPGRPGIVQPDLHKDHPVHATPADDALEGPVMVAAGGRQEHDG